MGHPHPLKEIPMDTRTTSRAAWPVHVSLEGAAARVVDAGDGRAFELDAFRDACRLHAAELRREAMAEAAAAIGDVLRRLRVGAVQLLRRGPAAMPPGRARGA
jgi:hypothetical protein